MDNHNVDYVHFPTVQDTFNDQLVEEEDIDQRGVYSEYQTKSQDQRSDNINAINEPEEIEINEDPIHNTTHIEPDNIHSNNIQDKIKQELDEDLYEGEGNQSVEIADGAVIQYEDDENVS